MLDRQSLLDCHADVCMLVAFLSMLLFSLVPKAALANAYLWDCSLLLLQPLSGGGWHVNDSIDQNCLELALGVMLPQPVSGD